jgi:hypothetical protein
MSMPVRHDDGMSEPTRTGRRSITNGPDPPAFPMFGKRFDKLLAR